jgi:hypothetical protein
VWSVEGEREIERGYRQLNQYLLVKKQREGGRRREKRKREVKKDKHRERQRQTQIDDRLA